MTPGGELDNIEAARKRYEVMPHLKQVCQKCRMCELGWSMADEYDPHVFSNYDPQIDPAKFMIVGQNPGWNEVKQGLPFVGAAGGQFDHEINKTIWRRGNFYITNSVKCYTKGNSAPLLRQMERCEPFLLMEIAIIKPVMVIAFGSIAFKVLCGANSCGRYSCTFSNRIGKITDSDKFGVKVFTTYHPSPLNLMVEVRRKQFERDIAMIGKILNNYLTPF